MLEHPERLMGTALFLLLFGCTVPFLIVTQALPSTFFLNFLSFIASVLGLFLGIIGIAQQRMKDKKKKGKEDFYE